MISSTAVDGDRRISELIIICLLLFVVASLVTLFTVPYFRYNLIDYGNDLEKYDITKEYNSDKVVISLTTIPERLPTIGKTLQSILRQTLKTSIEVNLPLKCLVSDKPYIIPEEWQGLQRLRFIEVEKDYGPATKLLPTLKRHSPDTMIVVVDDDRIYEPHLVERLIEKLKEGKGEYVVTSSGWNWKEGRYHIKNEKVSKHKPLKKVDVLRGVEGYALYGHQVDSAIFNYENVPTSCVRMDDVWISHHVNTIKLVYFPEKIHYPPNSISWETSAVLKNVSTSRADLNNECYKYLINKDGEKES